jgi:hypothetical protein
MVVLGSINYRNTLTPEGKIMMAAVFGFIFAAIIAVIVRELAVLSQNYFLGALLTILFVVGAIIGNTIRKASQKT